MHGGKRGIAELYMVARFPAEIEDLLMDRSGRGERSFVDSDDVHDDAGCDSARIIGESRFEELNSVSIRDIRRDRATDGVVYDEAVALATR